MADRIAIMRDGLIEQVGTSHDVFAKPANVFVASFIGTPQMNLVEADLKSSAGGRATVVIDHEPLVISVNAAAAALAPGKVTIGIRPRAFTPANAASKSAITAAAELIEPMGAETLIHARTKSGADIRVVVPREKRVKAGEILHLEPEAAQTHVFNSEGRAVRA
jgi:multiple sugar transport system ATP-binding protein